MLGIEHVASRRIGGKGEFPGRSVQTSSRRERASGASLRDRVRGSTRVRGDARTLPPARGGKRTHPLLLSCSVHAALTTRIHFSLLTPSFHITFSSLPTSLPVASATPSTTTPHAAERLPQSPANYASRWDMPRSPAHTSSATPEPWPTTSSLALSQIHDSLTSRQHPYCRQLNRRRSMPGRATVLLTPPHSQDRRQRTSP